MPSVYFLIVLALLPLSAIAAGPKSPIDATLYVQKGMIQLQRDQPVEKSLSVTQADVREAQPVINEMKYCSRLSVNNGMECLRLLAPRIYLLTPNAQQLVKLEAVPEGCGSGKVCYDKKQGPFATEIFRLIFLIDVMSGDPQLAAQSFANIAMCYWSHNNFAGAKRYIDQFQYLLPLASHSYHGIVQDSMAHADPNLLFQKALLWFFGHRFVRFMENTRRTKHSYLCRKGHKSCLDAAWEMMQQVKSASFAEAHIASLLANSSPKISGLYDQRSKLKVERALLKLFSTDQPVSQPTHDRIHELNEHIRVLDFSLHKVIPALQRIETPTLVNLNNFKRKLKKNETFISFIMSMSCRQPLIWRVEKNRPVKFKRVGTKRECSTTTLITKIQELRDKISKGMSLNELDPDLKWFRQQLFDPIGLPPVGTKLILSVDEKLAGLPFELIPTKRGRLGDIYQVTYVPSASRLYEWRTAPTRTGFPIPYMGFSRNNHSHFGLSTLMANEVLSSYLAPRTGPHAVIVTEANEKDIYNRFDTMVQAKYVHFITHTYEKNGFLGLSYGNDNTEDGLLTGPEIAAKLFINADTVLVTACDTAGASQPLLPGEAFSSLAVGFVTAGAKRLLITLWPVTDEIAGQFAAYYLHHRQNGKSPHAALQMARKALKHKAPHYWAGFILMGD